MTEVAVLRLLQIRKFHKIHMKTTVLKSFFNKVADIQSATFLRLRRNSGIGVFLWNFVECLFNRTLSTNFLSWTKMLLRNGFCLRLWNVFDSSYLKLTSPDHISSIYQLMLLIFKVSYHYHWNFQNVSFSLTQKSTAVNRIFSVKKLLDSMIGAFLIVFPFSKKSCRPASDITCLTDIYLK